MIKVTKSDTAGIVVLLLVAIGMGAGLAEMQLAGQVDPVAERVDLYPGADGAWVRRAPAPENGTLTRGWLDMETGIYATSAQEFNVLVATRQAQDQVDRSVAKAEMDAGGGTEFTWAEALGIEHNSPMSFADALAAGNTGESFSPIVWTCCGEPWAGADGPHGLTCQYQFDHIIFFGHPVDRVEVDPETGLISIFAQVAPVGSR